MFSTMAVQQEAGLHLSGLFHEEYRTGGVDPPGPSGLARHPIGLRDVRDVQQVPQDIHEAPRARRAFAVHGVFEQGLLPQGNHGDLRVFAADIHQEAEIVVYG
jgi:hypothetical protein